MTANVPPPAHRTGSLILLVAATLALAIAIFNNFWSGNGIHGTAGTLLVVVSSALMLGAASALLFVTRIGRGLRSTLVVLISLDIIGTALAAYMLDANWLVAAMALALVGLAVRLTSDRAPTPSALTTMAQRGAE